MRILKKSLALLIALTMMASLVVVSATESTEKVEISLGEASVLTLTSDQENIAIPVYVQNTELTTFCALSATFSVSDSDAVEYTGFDLTKQQIDGVPEQYCPYVLQDATLTTNADNILIDALNDFAAMPEKTQIGTAKFTVAANADPGEYEINFTVAVGGLTNYSMQDVEYNVTAGKITVIEEQWISSIGAEDFGEIEYGVPAPNFPATVKGEGVTSRGKVIAATDDPGVVLDVDWADIDTFVEPTEDLSVVGTITTAETDLLKYKDASGEAIDAPDATATYDIVKSTVGVVAPVEIEVEARLGGTEADVAAIVALDEIKAVADTTIAIEGGETETVTLNWEGATLAEPADATLNLGTAGDSIVLNVPLAGTATYYDLEDKIAAVTITVAEAVKMYNEIEAVTVETEEIYLTKYATLVATHKKHIHMEKPGGLELAAFEKLIDMIKNNGTVFHIGYMYRYNPYIMELKEQIQHGEFGEIVSVEAQMNCVHPPKVRQWLENFPGGIMFFLGCHLVDLILQLQGKPENIIPLSRSTGHMGVTAEDFGMAVFEYPSGVSFAKVNATEVGGFGRRQLVVAGTKKTVELKPLEWYEAGGLFTGKVEYTSNNWHDAGVAGKSDIIDRYDKMMTSFAAMVRGEMENPYTYDYELELYRTLMKVCGR